MSQASTPPVSPNGMRLFLAEVRIEGFRGLKDVCVPLAPLTVLIGENNTGKTSFLEALHIAFGGERADLRDLHVDANGRRATRFVLDMLFQPPPGSQDFDDDIRSVVDAAMQLPADRAPFFAMRTVGTADVDEGAVRLTRYFLRGWARDATSADALVTAGPTSGRQLRGLVAFFLLDAKRDVVTELRNKRTYWGRLTANLGLDEDLVAKVEATLSDLGSEIVAGSSVLDAAQKQLSELRSALPRGASGVQVAPLPARIGDLLHGMDVHVTSTGGSVLPIGRHGMGTRSLAALLVFRAFVAQQQLRPEDTGYLPLAAFEEPEAHLHPQAQRAVFAILKGVRGQSVLSTHSPTLVGVSELAAIRHFLRHDQSTRVRWIERDAISSEDAIKVRRFVQEQNADLLFARSVLLFEGDAEQAALPVFAQSVLGDAAESFGLSLVNVGGSGNYQHFVTVLEQLAIPWTVLSDNDSAGEQGVVRIASRIGRQPDSDDVVALPTGQDFEAYLVAHDRLLVEAAIAAEDGPRALEDWARRRHGRQRGSGHLRDYQSTGTEAVRTADYLRDRKGVYGRWVAEEFVKAKRVPPLIRQALENARRKAGP